MITTLSIRVADAIRSGPSFWLNDFIAFGDCNDVFPFAHHNFFYSYPEFGKQWPDGKPCEFHRVDTGCHLCGYQPSRNHAGVGNLYLLHNGVSDEQILVRTGATVIRGREIQHKEWVPNTPRLSRMILLCPQHAKGYFPFKMPVSESQSTKTIE
jgi:hypothetical protein